MDGWWRWVWAGQTTRRVTLGAGGLSRGLRGILARHRISCSVRWLLACKRVLSHPPPSACTVSLVRLPLGYSSYPLTCSNLTSTSPNVGLTSAQPATGASIPHSSQLQCSRCGLSTKCEPALIHPPPSPAESHALKKGEIHTEECVKASFSIFSNVFCFESHSCNFALSSEQKGRNSHQGMCQSLGIPMPKFSISTVPSSHGSPER